MFSYKRDDNHGDAYQKMVDQMQLLELMFDSHNPQMLSGPPPVRTKSEPVLENMMEEFQDSEGAALKSFPGYRSEKPSDQKSLPKLESFCINGDNMVKDSPVKPVDTGEALQPIKCMPPLDIKGPLIVQEIHGGVAPIDDKDDSRVKSTPEKIEKPRPVPRPRVKVNHQSTKEIKRPIPAPRKNLPHKSGNTAHCTRTKYNHGQYYENSDMIKELPSSRGDQVVESTPLEKHEQRDFPVRQETEILEQTGPITAWPQNSENVGRNNEPQIIHPEEAGGHFVVDEEYEMSDVNSIIRKIRNLCLNHASDEQIWPVVDQLLKTCSCISEKYTILDVPGLLEDNKDAPNHCLMFIALNVLEKYATNLLKSEADRPPSWRYIKFINEIFQQKVGFLKGAPTVLKKLGYEQEIRNDVGDVTGLKFPETVKSPNRKMVENLAVDLCIAKFEIREIVNETHPKLKMLFDTGDIPAEYRLPDESDDENFEDALSYFPEEQTNQEAVNGRKPIESTPAHLEGFDKPIMMSQGFPSIYSDLSGINSRKESVSSQQDQQLYSTTHFPSPGTIRTHNDPINLEPSDRPSKYINESKSYYKRPEAAELNRTDPIQSTTVSRVRDSRDTSPGLYTSTQMTGIEPQMVRSYGDLPIPGIYSDMSHARFEAPRIPPNYDPRPLQRETGAFVPESYPRYNDDSLSWTGKESAASSLFLPPGYPQKWSGISRVPDVYQETTRLDRSTQGRSSSQGRYGPSSSPFIDSRQSNVSNQVSSQEKGQIWSCKHCTFHNPVGTKVCQMCFKTSWEDKREAEPDIEIIQATYPEERRHPEIMTPPIRSTSGYSGLPTSPEPPSQVYDLYEGTSQGYGAVHDDLDLRAQEYFGQGYTPAAPHFNGRYRHNSLETTVQTEIYGSGRDGLYMRKPPMSELTFAQFQTRPMREKRSMSEHETRKQRELAEKVMQEKRNQEELKKDAESMIEVLRIAENSGYDIGEVEVASKMSQNGILDWLQTEWPLLKNAVIEVCAKDIGGVSLEEAQEALINSGGDVKKASALCIQERYLKVRSLAEHFEENDIIGTKDFEKALLDCKGQKHEAILELEQKLLAPFRERVWKNEEEEAWKNFYNKLMSEDTAVEHRTSLILAQFKMKSWGRAGTVVKLIDYYSNERGNEPHFLNDCIEAANANEHIERAKRYMEHECKMCYTSFAKCNVFLHYFCNSNDCEICDGCVAGHVTQVVKEQNISKLVCPCCNKPGQLDDSLMPHFQHLSHKIKDLVRKGHLDENVQRMFEEKLRDFSLKDDPNFRWCAHCPEYGFLWEEPERIEMYCTKCKKYTCFLCREKWEPQHKGISCEAFKAWKNANDPQNQAKGLSDHLAENGISCPKCNARYDLARGGCIHFRCPGCEFQFCGDCGGEFFAAMECQEHPDQGVHGHHPRNCLYYLRDFEVKSLQEILTSKNIEFKKDAPEGQDGKCTVMEQKEDVQTQRKSDEVCGKDAPIGFAGFCEKHYKEYLVKLINENQLDPLIVMDENKIKRILERHKITSPAKEKKEKRAEYLDRLRKVAKEKIPFKVIGRGVNQPQQEPQQQPQMLQAEPAQAEGPN